MIENRQDIFADAVRTEEFINYFKYDYPQPDNDDKIGITTELSDCPWNDEKADAGWLAG
jgi:Ca-activated chloride channel family protein